MMGELRKVGRDTPFSPLYHGRREPTCSWCGKTFVMLDEIQLCMTCDRTVVRD